MGLSIYELLELEFEDYERAKEKHGIDYRYEKRSAGSFTTHYFKSETSIAVITHNADVDTVTTNRLTPTDFKTLQNM